MVPSTLHGGCLLSLYLPQGFPGSLVLSRLSLATLFSQFHYEHLSPFTLFMFEPPSVAWLGQAERGGGALQVRDTEHGKGQKGVGTHVVPSPGSVCFGWH